MNLLPPGHQIGEPQPLFAKIDQEVIEEYKKRFAGKQDSRQQSPPKDNAKLDFSNVDVETLEEAVTKQVGLALFWFELVPTRIVFFRGW